MANRLSIDNIADFEDFISNIPPNCVFRGQNHTYYDVDGNINIPASFERHGCIPSEMLKWSKYSIELLNRFYGDVLSSRNQHFMLSQAILQHYGWRSFYIDCTKDIGVAAWFAANNYQEINGVSLIEECFERGILVRNKRAKYIETLESGDIYVISLDSLKTNSIDIHDISDMQAPNMNSRPVRQSALLIGPTKSVHPDSILFHISVTFDVLKTYYTKLNYTQDHLFPNMENDEIYAFLRTLPYYRVTSDSSGYRQAIILPDYSDNSPKIWPKEYAFFDPFKPIFTSGQFDLTESQIFQAPGELLYYDIETADTIKIPTIAPLVLSSSRVLIEFNELFRHPEQILSANYFKGIYVELIKDGLICVSSVNVEHQGLEVISSEISRGLHYLVNEDYSIVRIAHEDNCPCENEYIHKMNEQLLLAIEFWLTNTRTENALIPE